MTIFEFQFKQMEDFFEDKQDKTDNWETFINLFAARYCENGVLSAQLDSYRFCNLPDEEFPKLSGIMLYILILSGETEIRIDNKSYRGRSDNNNLIIVKPVDEIQHLRISNDFKGYLLGIQRRFLANPVFMPSIPSNYLSQMLTLQVSALGVSDMQYLMSLGRKIERHFSRDTVVSHDLAWLSVMEFHLELSELVIGRIETQSPNNPNSRKHTLCIKFFDLLLQHSNRRREVAFYAEQLCITPQYLARVCREVIGVSPKEAIDRIIVSTIHTLLRSNRSLQQIAEELGFADQSSFGKFFKKYVGVSPAQYRENQML